jgi:hypothetical protein
MLIFEYLHITLSSPIIRSNMLERQSEDPTEKYSRMSPQELNREFKGLYDLLPDYTSICYVTNDEYSSIEDIIRKQLEAFTENHDDYETSRQQRLNSDLHTVIIGKFSTLLTYASDVRHLITKSCSSNILLGVEHTFEFGLDRSGMEDFNSELDSLTKINEWDNPESGGIFDPEKSAEVEGKMYHAAVNSLFSREKVHEKLEKEFIEDPFWLALKEKITTDRIAEKIMDQLLSPEEQLEKKKAEESSAQFVRETDQKWLDEEQLVKNWRLEYIDLHGNEP